LEEFFICGLLHDLGKIILLQHLQPKFEQALIISRDRGIPLFEAEMIAIGCTHADVGGVLAKRWNLSKETVCAILCHHGSAEVPKEQARYVAVTRMADYLARAKEIGGGGGVNPRFERAVWDTVGLSKSKIPSILLEIDKSFDSNELGVSR
jgi:HD-like signal output (HDOD) protein